MLPLEAEIRRRIRAAGPMPVSEFMALCLTHPQHGYYCGGDDPLGKAGDFTTAPEISQMFGELVGLWAAAVWRAIGEPGAINLVELGPGRGTMMADIMRAVRLLPPFERAITIHLVETSPRLRDRQKQKLAEYGERIFWHTELRDVPTTLSIYVANEFFDTLPVSQAVRQPDGWYERMIDVDSEGLKFKLSAAPLVGFEHTVPHKLRDAPVGSLFEWRSPLVAMELGRRVATAGAALVIDYGHSHSAIGETFQAVRGHRFDNPLTRPGLADLSAHVDFEALGRAASSLGAQVHGPVDQGAFLLTLGIERRATTLKQKASAEQAAAIDIALERLTAANKTGMGAMFKVLGLSNPGLPQLPGFERKLSTGGAK